MISYSDLGLWTGRLERNILNVHRPKISLRESLILPRAVRGEETFHDVQIFIEVASFRPMLASVVFRFFSQALSRPMVLF